MKCKVKVKHSSFIENYEHPCNCPFILFMVVWFVFVLFFLFQSQMIKSMLCANPEDRPEASKLKMDLEQWKCSFTKLKTMQCDSNTV